MKLRAAARLLRLLGTRPDTALTAREICDRWADQTGSSISLRTVQRYVAELSADSADGPALMDVLDDGRESRYYLRLSQVAHWFMTEEAALGLLWSHQILARSFAAAQPEPTVRSVDLAQRVADDCTRTRRLRGLLRIVPDGLGRLPARIDPQVLVSVVDAIGAGQQVGFEYRNAAGKARKHERSPQGLVAKDGTIYLLATDGPNDSPLHFALHRMSSAVTLPRPALSRPGFDLDRYIHESHQLSHRLQSGDAPPLDVRLRVSPQSLFHFIERPLAADQQIGEPDPNDGWSVVGASVPDTVLLLPFLISIRDIEVRAPAMLRRQMTEWLRRAVARHDDDSVPRRQESTPSDIKLALPSSRSKLCPTPKVTSLSHPYAR
jgi:predicted DNA-binding transcriptional regulator YafY